MKSFVAFLLLILSGIYLLNFTVGVFELPDYLPIIGNLDEALAAFVFISALKQFGVDLTGYLPFGHSLGRHTQKGETQKATA